MKKGKSWGYIVGALVWESIWIIEIIVDLYNGEVTYTDVVSTLIFSLLFGVVFYSIIRSIIKRKKR